MELKRYKVVSCPRCGHLQTTSAVEVFSCIRCKASRKIHTQQHAGTNLQIHGSFHHPRDASLFLLEYKKRLASKQEQELDFTSAHEAL